MILNIDRRDVESGIIAGVLARLLELTDSRESMHSHHASVSLRFAGYEDHPHELFDIPEARAFMAALTAEWPHWLWFLRRGDNSIPLLLSLLCRVNVVRGPAGYVTEFADGAEFFALLDGLLERSRPLYDYYGIPEYKLVLCARSALMDIFEGFL